jgi:hypothetical protein
LRAALRVANVGPVQEAESATETAAEPFRAGTATSVGSLPHRDADAAAEFVVRSHPALPAAPQLPRRSPLEGMVAQGARGIAGVAVAPDGSLTLDLDVLDPEAPVANPFDGAGHAGLLAFLTAVTGRTGPVKFQLTGPVTLGLALIEAGAEPDVAYPVAEAAVRAHGRALLELCRRRLPDAPLVVFLDEPGLVSYGDGLDLAPERIIDLLSSGLAVLEGDATTGVHCCGETDWRLVSAAGPTVLSLPATEAAVGDAGAGALVAHLERDGWVAWGAVPTSEPLGTDVDRLWRRLSDLWCTLVDAGADPVQLRAQALVTPACGLAGHGVSQAGRALRLAGLLGARVADQSAASRISVGA